MAINVNKICRCNNFFKYLQYNHNTNLCTRFRSLHNSSLFYATTKINMPSLSPTMSEGTITKWFKKEGDPIEPGDVLCEIQTDKAVVSFETEEEGILAKIIKSDTSGVVKIGTLIALMVDEGDDWKNVDVPVSIDTTEEKHQANNEMSKNTSKPISVEKTSLTSYGPAVRVLLEIYGLKVNDIISSATGPGGKILKSDVLDYISKNGLKAINIKERTDIVKAKIDRPKSEKVSSKEITTDVAPQSFEDIPLTNMRRTIAKRLTQSKSSIPHSYAMIDCDMGSISKMRKQLKEENIKVSVNDFIIKATAAALQAVPEMNVLYMDNKVRALRNIDISVAVSTDAGLITPIVFNADKIGLLQISECVRDLAERGRKGKLLLNEFQGGTFTISNLGMFGIDFFTAVINPPQAGILALGGTRSVFKGDLIISNIMTAQLSYDARAISDDSAQMFLQAFQTVLEKPSLLMIKQPANKQIFN